MCALSKIKKREGKRSALRGETHGKKQKYLASLQIPLGLSILITLVSSLNAIEIFNTLDSRLVSGTLDYSDVKKVSFHFLGIEGIDVDKMIQGISKEKAYVVVTGKDGIDGEALSPNISIDVISSKNPDGSSYLITIEAHVLGTTEKVKKDGVPYKGSIPIMSHILVFTDVKNSMEIEQAISSHLENFVSKITSSTKTKPKFFVIH